MPIPRRMDMKAMMFAGGGLFLSMVATTIWISGDVNRMRAEEQAKQAQACVAAQQQDAANLQATANTAPASDFATPVAQEADSACADANGGATGGQTDPNGAAAVDPVTGQPLAQPDTQFVDPATAPVDPAFDPAASGGSAIDPVTGLPMDGSASGAGAAPDIGVAEAGF